MPIKRTPDAGVPRIVTAAVQTVGRRLARMEALLIEMRAEQDVKLRKINRLQLQFDELTDIVKRRIK